MLNSDVRLDVKDIQAQGGDQNQQHHEQQQQSQQQQQPSATTQSTLPQQTNTLNQPAGGINPTLFDHDYCTTTDKLGAKKTRKTKKPSKASNPIAVLQATGHQQAASIDSTTSPSNKVFKDSKTITNETFSSLHQPSPSSSSPCSSERSSVNFGNNLVIAHSDIQSNIKSKPIAPQDTPSIKRKPGRPPLSGRKVVMGSVDNVTTKIKKERTPRQSTSVTDKSQWIVGEEEIDSALSEHANVDRVVREKRHRIPKELDSAFSQYTSSDCSSSDAESNEDDNDDDLYNSEDDPDRLWCICQKPHENKFMICCDVCKDWFHGHCVGVTKLMGDRFEKQGKEWFCAECHEKLRSGIPRAAIPIKIVKKEKKKKPGRKGRGRPRKSGSVRESSTRLSLRSSRKSSSSLDPKLGVDNSRLRKNLARPDPRSESFDEFQDSQKLKELIRERKKAFFYKRELAAKQKALRRSELGLAPKQALTANLSDSLDSLATSTNSPNMNNLPINIKERPKPNIVLQINIGKDPKNDQTNPSSRIVTTIVRSPKKNKLTESNPVVNDLFTADPIQINKKSTSKPSSSTPSIATTSSTSEATTSATDPKTSTSANGGQANIRKRSDSSSSPSKKFKHSDHGDVSIPKKKRKDSESSTNGSTTPCGSNHVIQKFKETFELRMQQIQDLDVSVDKVEKIATEIESKLNEHFKEGTSKYRTKYMSVISNLKDKKNLGLVKNVLNETISPDRLVNMTPEELASSELAKWRERENKHSIELIKRDAQLAAQQVIVKKTHKGEEVISAPQLNEPDDPSISKDNQETPATPNKLSAKDIPRVDGSKITLTPPVIQPPTIKPMDLDLLPSIDQDRSPNDPNCSPDFEDYRESIPTSSSVVDDLIGAQSVKKEQHWSGTISMPDISKFSVSAKPVCGLVDFEKDQIHEKLEVCGRIPPDQVQNYIKKLKATTKNHILMLQLFPLKPEDKSNFDVLFDYLYSRNRYGVIQTNPQILKDFYIIPIHDKGNIPEVLRPTVKGPGIDRTNPNCLIGLLVRNKKPTGGTQPAPGSSSSEQLVNYTPTPINQ